MSVYGETDSFDLTVDDETLPDGQMLSPAQSTILLIEQAESTWLQELLDSLNGYRVVSLCPKRFITVINDFKPDMVLLSTQSGAFINDPWYRLLREDEHLTQLPTMWFCEHILQGQSRDELIWVDASVGREALRRQIRLLCDFGRKFNRQQRQLSALMRQNRAQEVKIKRQEEALSTALAFSIADDEESFFKQVVASLASISHCRCALVAVPCETQADYCETLAVWLEGEQSNFRYCYIDTPCEQVFEHGMVIHESRVAEIYPADTWLAQNRIESYIGLAITKADGSHRGHIVLMDTQEMADSGELIRVLRLFAERLSIELNTMAIRNELKLANELLETSNEAAKIGLWNFDVPTNRLFWNKMTCKIHGVSADFEPVVSEAINYYTAGWSRQRIAEVFTLATAQGVSYDEELTITNAQGNEIWVRAMGIPVFHNEQCIRVYGIFQDIDERKRAELDLIRFQNTLNQTLDSVFISDPQSLRIEYVNEGACQHLGYSRQELLQMHTYDFKISIEDMDALDISDGPHAYRPLGSKQRYQITKRLVEPLLSGQKQKLRFESVHEHKSGKLIPVEILLQYIKLNEQSKGSLVAIVRDISDRVESLAQIEAQTKRADIILENVLDGIVTISEKGIIESFNPAAESMFGYTAGEVKGKNVSILMSRQRAVEHDQYIQNYVQSGVGKIIGVGGRELLAKHKNGRLFPIELAVSEATIASKTVFTGIIHEISHRKEIENNLIIAKNEAVEANKAKTEFLSSMSHELRTPLNAIIGFSQLLEYDPKLNDDNRENVTEILKASRHLLGLINEVLDLAKIEAGDMSMSIEVVELMPLLTECRLMLQKLAKQKAIEMSFVVAENLAVQADRVRLKQVILNILSNAIKYNKVGGFIEVTCVSVANNRYRIVVRDSGIGIAREKIKELFQPFNRLDAEFSDIEGTGIGLALSRKMIEHMDGTMGAASEQGKGSRFWFELNAGVKTIMPQVGQSDMTEGVSGLNHDDLKRHRVLYIEDNPANIKLLEKIFVKKPSIELQTANTSELGLHMAMNNPPDLILLDINLPGMNGYQLLSVMRNHGRLKQIPILALTANALTADIEKGLAAGFSDYLTKPFNIDKLDAVLKSYLS